MADFKFVWKIKNYNFLLSQRGKALKSPVFNVNPLESSFLELYPKGDILDLDQASVTICLKNCTKLAHTNVDCDLKLLTSEFSPIEQFSKFPIGKVNDCLKWGFKKQSKENNVSSSEEKVDEFAKVTLVVTCTFSHKDSGVSKSSSTILNEKDVKLLSKDMEKIYISKEFHDLNISSGADNFPVHKAVLYARVPKLLNELLNEAYDDTTNKVVIDLDASALRILLSYVYSGKLDSYTENIPNSLYKVADTYELPDLKQKLFSYPNEVIAHTSIKYESKKFQWSIIDPWIMLQGTRFYSPSFPASIIPGSDIKLSCHLSSRPDSNSVLEICVHRLFPNKDNPLFIKCRFSVNSSSRVAEHVFYSDEEWHFPSFIPLVDEGFDLFINGKMLVVVCEFCVSSGEIVCTEETHSSFEEFFGFVNRNTDASNLCNDLGVLYNIFLPKMSDVVLTIGAVNFPAHKVLLAARSPVFAKMFENDMIEKKTGIVDIKDIDVAILNMMLTYMYSAKVETLNFDSALKLYSAADRYEVMALKEHCSTFLKQDLSAFNCCEILIFADMHGDTDLKTFTKDFICTHAEEILDMPEWNHLIDSRIELAKDILRSLTVRVHAQIKACATCKVPKKG